MGIGRDATGFIIYEIGLRRNTGWAIQFTAETQSARRKPNRSGDVAEIAVSWGAASSAPTDI